jgi:3-deoxy-D-manno-octulosonic-acid transferase
LYSLSLFIYNKALWLYRQAAQVLSPVYFKAKLWTSGRRQTLSKIKAFTTPASKNRVWFHCSSLGEWEQARPVMEYFASQVNDCILYLSFFSPSGYEPVRSKNMAHHIFYLLDDTEENARLFIEKLQPTLVFWTKYDFFYHHLLYLKNRNIPTILFSARFLPGQIFFKSYGVLHRKMLHSFTQIFVQDVRSKLLLQSIGLEADIASDTRFDRVKNIAEKNFSDRKIEQYIENVPLILVAGSTWPEDETLIAGALRQLSGFKLIVAPHRIDARNIECTQKNFRKYGMETVLYSTYIPANTTARVLVVDNIGMLSYIYRFATVAYVGGGFGKGVHNVLESVVYGKHTLVGPRFQKSLECVELVKMNVVLSVNNEKQLTAVLSYLAGDEQRRQSIAQKARAYIEANSGGSQKIFKYARKYLHEN